MSFCLFGCGGTSGPSTTRNDTEVTVSNNIYSPPINISVGADAFNPIAQTFRPLTDGIENSLQSLTVGFQDAEVRRSKQDNKTAELVQLNAKTQQIMIVVLIGLAAVLVLRG